MVVSYDKACLLITNFSSFLAMAACICEENFDTFGDIDHIPDAQDESHGC